VTKSGLGRRVRLDGIRLRGLLGRKQARLGALNIILYWIFFVTMLLLIANDAPLGAEWVDHPLKGDWADHRECHIGGDFLLAYKLHDSGKHGLIVFVRASMATISSFPGLLS